MNTPWGILRSPPRGGDAGQLDALAGFASAELDPGPAVTRRHAASSRSTTDTLVIGAGSAGLFAALRAAGHGSVIVVETGPDAGDPPPDWALHEYALPEAHYHRYADLASGQVMPQGRGLGGGSTVNSAAALRGQPWCYDSWGVPGWGWADVLPALNAIESDQQYPGRAYHGDAGLIPITRLAPGPLDEAFFEWCDVAGYPAIEDHNAPGALGHAMWTTNRRDGGRWGTWAGVAPAARRAGAGIRPDTTATRLTIDGTRCTGAQVTGPEGTEVITAGRVIVCAGAYGSPELLLRSGIGPLDVLAALGVEPVSVLPGVGANVQDHPWCLLNVDVTDAAFIEVRPVSGALLRYELDDAQASHVEAEIFPWQLRPYDLSSPPATVAFTAALMTPRSRGSFTLTPAGRQLRVGLLADDRDAAHMASVVRETAALIDGLAKDGVVTVPDGAWWRAGADDQLAAACRRAVGTYNHHSGTCRLGDPDAAGTVVAPDLSVLGITGLFVADSSILPVIPRANTNLISMAIGYRAPSLAI
jgi:choline dehydrogenase